MKDHLAANDGQLRWGKLVRDGELLIKDLPWMTTPNGKKVCWRHVLSSCKHGAKCHFHHFARTDLSDGFCHEVCRIMKPVLAKFAKVKDKAENARDPKGGGGCGRGGGAPGRQ